MKLGKFTLPSAEEPISQDDHIKLNSWASATLQALRFYIYMQENEGARAMCGSQAYSAQFGKYRAPGSEDFHTLTLTQLKQLEFYIEHLHLIQVSYSPDINQEDSMLESLALEPGEAKG